MRDRVRKAFVLLSARLSPRLPFVGALPVPPPPPIFVPSKGFMPPHQIVEVFFPKLSDTEEITLDTQLGLLSAILGTEVRNLGLEEVSFASIQQLVFNPGAQLQDVQQVLANLAGNPADLAVVQQTSEQVISNIMHRISMRAGVSQEDLFPGVSRLFQTDLDNNSQAMATRSSMGGSTREVKSARPLQSSGAERPQMLKGAVSQHEDAGKSGNGAAEGVAKAGSWGGLGTTGEREQRGLQSQLIDGAVDLNVNADAVTALSNGGEVGGTMQLRRDGTIKMMELKPRQQK
jgi:hypothetical protein